MNDPVQNDSGGSDPNGRDPGRTADDDAVDHAAADPRDRLIDAALALGAANGWRSVSMGEIALRADVPLVDAYDVFPSKTAILDGFVERTDRTMLSADAPDPQEPTRDRLFEMVMRRFDALQPHKRAVAALLADLPSDPVGMLIRLPAFSRSLRWMLEAAALSTTGLAGVLRIKGLALIYLSTMRVWLEDDTADLARTMAALDRGLRRGEMLMRACTTMTGRFSPVRPVESGPASAGAAADGPGEDVPPASHGGTAGPAASLP